jgi:transcriptional regulator with XRE-family HTH domain
MVLLRRVIGDALRSRRQAQRRTLREVSTAANVSLGYLSEIERGQKEASSELLAAICEALGARLSELLREASHTVASAEGHSSRGADEPAMAGVGAAEALPSQTADSVSSPASAEHSEPSVRTMVDGDVSVTVRQDTPLSATLRATRTVRRPAADRDVLSAA